MVLSVVDVEKKREKERKREKKRERGEGVYQSRMNVLDVVFVGCEDDALPLDQSFFTADRAVGSRQGHGEPLVQVAIGNALRGAAFQRRRRRVERHKLVVRHDVIVGVITGLFLRCSFLC